MTSVGDFGLRMSESESARFGLRIARWNPSDPSDIASVPADGLAGFDVVILRRPAGWVEGAVALLGFDGFAAIHADTLVYWAWIDRGGRLPSTVGSIVHRSSPARLDGLVREVFSGYQNHYAANPLLGRAEALDGYVEWAVATGTDNGYVTVDDEAGPIGFAVVDWSCDPPDVRLAGLCVRARGAGRYRDLVLAAMSQSRELGHTELRISTQAQNIAVQRTWASLGWNPIDAFDTTHLVRAELLERA